MHVALHSAVGPSCTVTVAPVWHVPEMSGVVSVVVEPSAGAVIDGGGSGTSMVYVTGSVVGLGSPPSTWSAKIECSPSGCGMLVQL